MTDFDNYWLDEANKQLLDRRIVKVRYLSQDEANDMGWHCKPIVLQLDDGNLIFPSADDEGNDGGALFTNNDDVPVFPVMRG